jgi:hypothetical protein
VVVYLAQQLELPQVLLAGLPQGQPQKPEEGSLTRRQKAAVTRQAAVVTRQVAVVTRQVAATARNDSDKHHRRRIYSSNWVGNGSL